MNISYVALGHGQRIARDLITAARENNPQFTVIDVGGYKGGWSHDLTNVTIDINAPSDATNIQMDICRDDQWGIVRSIVNTRGKYDFAICTHTLEDIYNPVTVLEMLPLVAKAGIITMPAAWAELSNVESKDWLGYIHHRWIFDQRDGRMLLVPKMPFLESYTKAVVNLLPKRGEICYLWQDSIPYEIFMNNYLGPDINTVVGEYGRFLQQVSSRVK